MFHLLKIAQTVIKTPEDIYAEFQSYLNMSSPEVEQWLKTPFSKSLLAGGSYPDMLADKKISQKVLKIISKKKFMLTKGDYACLEKVNAFITHLYTQQPITGISESTWRYAMMNLGHDPLKNEKKVNSSQGQVPA